MSNGRTAILAALISAGLFASAQAQTGTMETRAVTGGLGISSGTAKILESVIGELSGPAPTGSVRKVLSGHARTSHSPGVLYDIAVTTAPVDEGQVRITYTTPGRDGFRGQLSYVEVKIATYAINASNYEAITSSLTLVALSTGTADLTTYYHLVPGPTYYAAGRGRDAAGMKSRLSPTPDFLTSAVAPDPVTTITIVNSTYGAVNITWDVTGDDASTGDITTGYFRIAYSSVPAEAALFSSASYTTQISTSAAEASQQYYPLSGLQGNVTYYAAVFIGDEVTVYSGIGTIAQLVTMSYPPTQSGFSNLSSDGFTVSYTADNYPGAQYYVQTSSDQAFSYTTDSGWITASSATFSGLDTNQTYYVRGKSRNSQMVETQYSDLGSISLALNVSKPKPPALSGAASGSDIVLSWNPVTYDITGGTTAIVAYDIYYSTGLNGVENFIEAVSSSVFTRTYTPPATRWYYVKARDQYSLRSDPSVWVKSSLDVSRVTADDDRAVVDMPVDAGYQLGASGLTLQISHQSQYETGLVQASYKVSLLDNNGNERVGVDLPAAASVTMPTTRTGAVTITGYSPSISYSTYDYAVFYYNGVEDVNIGGSVDPNTGTITVSTKKTGVFKVKQVIRPSSFRITQTVPRKIFTPNGDGIWDEFNIVYDNPEGLSISDAKVYDLSGAE
ncbi:MAG: hypothetical protein RQ748_09105, partial [Elusimicrobiales bacterium]|nr:hypothetical protein [Elusimicrobiales bacterium]